MFLKNLLRRKVRTLLTIVGIAIGVASIIAMGAMSEGLRTGYNSALTGSKADLIISQPDAFDIAYSAVQEEIGRQIAAAPEISEVSGMLQGFIQAEDQSIFFVFGYPEDSFALSRFQIIDGVSLSSREATRMQGKPVLLGSAASEVMKKSVGDSLRLTGSVYRVVGIYQTGDAFEDSGALLRLSDAQELLGRPRQVSLFYLRLKDPGLKDRFIQRVERTWKDVAVSGVEEFASQQQLADMMDGYVWAIGGLAIVIGGVGMMNAQLMSIMERIREIGVLRALGWRKWRVLWMILMEAMSVSLAGGVIGLGIGVGLLQYLSKATVIMGISPSYVDAGLLNQVLVVVIGLGLVGGVYPAWRAAQLAPVEALRYEGGTSGKKMRRLPFGGMALQSLWQRSTRTLLTLLAIGLTVGAIMALEGILRGASALMGNMFSEAGAEIMIRQAEVSDTSLSVIDQYIGDRIAAMPEVASASGLIFTAVGQADTGFFIIQGYPPNDFTVHRFRIIEGEPLTSNHQIILGSTIAKAMNKRVGGTIDVGGVRFRVVGIYQSKVSWEEMGGVITLRDAQSLTGKPRKSTMIAVKMKDPNQAEAFVERLNNLFPEIHASLAGEFVDQMPDMQNANGMILGISFLAILVGGVGVLNTMLMAVFERTREIGVLRALGWRRRAILGMILREALLLGLLGGIAGIGLAFFLVRLIQAAPVVGSMMTASWSVDIFVRALSVALSLGVLGGLYPAFRATQLSPVEALRYE